MIIEIKLVIIFGIMHRCSAGCVCIIVVMETIFLFLYISNMVFFGTSVNHWFTLMIKHCFGVITTGCKRFMCHVHPISSIILVIDFECWRKLSKYEHGWIYACNQLPDFKQTCYVTDITNNFIPVIKWSCTRTSSIQEVWTSDCETC